MPPAGWTTFCHQCGRASSRRLRPSAHGRLLEAAAGAGLPFVCGERCGESSPGKWQRSPQRKSTPEVMQEPRYSPRLLSANSRVFCRNVMSFPGRRVTASLYAARATALSPTSAINSSTCESLSLTSRWTSSSMLPLPLNLSNTSEKISPVLTGLSSWVASRLVA